MKSQLREIPKQNRRQDRDSFVVASELNSKGGKDGCLLINEKREDHGSKQEGGIIVLTGRGNREDYTMLSKQHRTSAP
jgi:hypothetical protein